MILIYSHKLSSRLKFTFRQIFQEILGMSIRFTTDPEEFKAYIGGKLSYSHEAIEDELFFQARDLLFEKGIHNREIHPEYFGETLGFFKVSKRSVFPFDPFAASFYLLSRYEEYLPFKPDEHGRFPFRESVLGKADFIQKPWVEIWALEVAELLKKKFPNLEFPTREFKALSTIDVDQAYAFKHKGMLRSFGTFGRQVFMGNFGGIIDQAKVWLNLKQDPFDTFNEAISLHRHHKIPCKFFFLVGDYGVYDQSIAYSHPKFRLAIKHISDYVEIGLHPSYRADAHQGRIRGEKKRLEEIIHREIYQTRHHFLRIKLPETYRVLADLGIKEDYSMGFAGHPGFRSGTSTPYYFYDLPYETTSQIKVHPFALMDVSLRGYLNLSPEEAMETVEKLIDEVKKVGGTFTSIWHNNSISDYGEWEGWKKVFVHQLEKMSS